MAVPSSTRAAPRAASAWPSEPDAPAAILSAALIERASPQSPRMIRRLLRSADFERVLRTRTQANTAHFAVHHVSDTPSAPAFACSKSSAPKLSTGEVDAVLMPVNDFSAAVAVWFGAVVPKRHARRSVTRTLLKRQIRAAMSVQQDALARGLWVVRLRAPFDRTVFPSAASDALKCAARDELEQLLAAAARRAGRLAVDR